MHGETELGTAGEHPKQGIAVSELEEFPAAFQKHGGVRGVFFV